MRVVRGIVFCALVLGACLTALADQPWSLFGDARFVKLDAKGNRWAVELSSTATTFSGIAFEPKKDATFADLKELSVLYLVEEGGLGGGSPRFQIALDTDGDGESDGNVFVYIGTPPNFDDNPVGWQHTGNLLASEDLRFDLTQFGGPFYGSYEDAVDLVGDADIVSVDLVVDAGWMFGEQTILVDDVRVDHFVLKGKKNKHKDHKPKKHDDCDEDDEHHGKGPKK